MGNQAVDGWGQAVHNLAALCAGRVLQGGSFLCQGCDQSQPHCRGHLCSRGRTVLNNWPSMDFCRWYESQPLWCGPWQPWANPWSPMHRCSGRGNVWVQARSAKSGWEAVVNTCKAPQDTSILLECPKPPSRPSHEIKLLRPNRSTFGGLPYRLRCPTLLAPGSVEGRSQQTICAENHQPYADQGPQSVPYSYTHLIHPCLEAPTCHRTYFSTPGEAKPTNSTNTDRHTSSGAPLLLSNSPRAL